MALSVLKPICVAFSIAALTLTVRVAFGQVPPHTPGTICFTPNFWCWALPPGQPGQPCSCPSPFGYVAGVLG